MSCHHNYLAQTYRRLSVLAVLAAALVLFALMDLASGGSSMPIEDVVAALLSGPKGESVESTIIWSIRLPMTLTALFVGTALATAGLEIQNITGNALASPSTLGISSAASFGAAGAITLGLTVFGQLWIGTALTAFVFALLVSLAIYCLGKVQGMSPTTLILSGIVMNFFFMALQQFLQYRSSPEIAQLIAGWTFGNLERSTWTSVTAAGLMTLVGYLYLMMRSWSLTALTLGEERAQSLGIAVTRLRAEVFFLSSLLIAAAVGFIGTVSFVGLVAPHCAKLMVGEDQRFLLPASLLTGGALMLLSSYVAKLFSSGSMLPVGIITSLVGVPFLLILLIRSRGSLA